MIQLRSSAQDVRERFSVGKPRASLAIAKLGLPTFAHAFDQAVRSHISPVLIDELQASGAGVRLVDDGPPFWNIDEARPEGMLAFIINQHMISAVLVFERICHFVLHRMSDRLVALCRSSS